MAGSCLALTGAAQSAYNPNLLPLGDRESFMANTGTGGLRSTGAVFYNPGALPQVEGDRFSLSGSAYMRFRFEADPIAQVAGNALKYRGAGIRSVPTSVILVHRVGAWYLGLGMLIPMAFHFEGQEDWSVPVDGLILDLKLLQNYQESVSMYGLTAARSLGRGWSAGLGVYAQRYRYLLTIDLKGNLQIDPSRLVRETLRERRAPFNLLLMAGLLKRWDKWSLGLRIMAPAVYVFGKGDYYADRFNNVGGQVETSTIDLQDIPVRFHTPLDVRAGLTYTPHVRWTLALDLSFAFPLQYAVFPDTPLDIEENTNGNFRFSGGLEYRWHDNFAVLGGGSYTPTTLRENEDLFGQDFWSAHLGGKLFTEHVEFGLGLFYILGRGEGLLAVGQGRTSERFEYAGFAVGTNYRF
jgi:hypothetical protein